MPSLICFAHEPNFYHWNWSSHKNGTKKVTPLEKSQTLTSKGGFEPGSFLFSFIHKDFFLKPNKIGSNIIFQTFPKISNFRRDILNRTHFSRAFYEFRQVEFEFGLTMMSLIIFMSRYKHHMEFSST